MLRRRLINAFSLPQILKRHGPPEGQTDLTSRLCRRTNFRLVTLRPPRFTIPAPSLRTRNGTRIRGIGTRIFQIAAPYGFRFAFTARIGGSVGIRLHTYRADTAARSGHTNATCNWPSALDVHGQHRKGAESMKRPNLTTALLLTATAGLLAVSTFWLAA